MRRTIMMTAAAGVLMLAAPAMARQTPAGDRSKLDFAADPVLQADGKTARERLQALSGLSAATERTRQCILERLDPDAALPVPPTDASFTERALHEYRLYWREAVNAPEARDEALDRLAGRLAALMAQPDMGRTDIERAVQERIRAEGRHVLGGQTGLLRDLMVWSGQEERDFDVELPEGRHTTRVFLLTDFQNRGWASWLTCGATGTGGWAKPEGLYLVAESYDLTSENFTASFLGHETQHFADYKTWPGLPGRELEYRAKLTELSRANVMLRQLLAIFTRNQSDNEADAHSHANKRVLAALRVRLGLPSDGDLATVPPDDLREAARQELFADSARRRAAAGGERGN